MARYEVIEREAEIVRQVYDLYTSEGLSINAIARWLNEHHVPTRKGISPWERTTVWAMLRNPAYRGMACFGKTEQAPRQRITPLRQRGGYSPRCSANHERPREEWLEIPVPPLVNEQQFALAQEQLENNRRYAPRRTIEATLLQSILVCKECGYAYYRTSTQTSKRKLYYYRCLGSDDYRYPNGRLCTNQPIRQDYLDELVWRHVMGLLEDPELIHAEIRRRIEATHRAAPTQRRKDAILKEVARVQNAIEKLLDAYQDGLLTLPELRKRVPELRKRQAALTSELQTLETSAVDQQLYLQLATTLEDFLARLRTSADTLNVIDRQRILRLVVKEVLVGRETLPIRHSIPVQRQDPTPPTLGRKIMPGYLLSRSS